MLFLFSLPFLERESIECGGVSKNNCPPKTPCEEPSTKYIYKDSHKSTIIGEYDLICEHTFIGWIGTAYFFGYLSFSYIFASLSEHIGRTRVIFIELVIIIIMGSVIFLNATSESLWMLVVGSTLVGVGSAYAGPGNNLAIDAVDSTNINTAILFVNCSFALMEILLGLAMLIHYSWHTHIYISILWYIFWALSLLYMQEGPRYHIFKGQFSHAIRQFHNIANWNGYIYSSPFPNNAYLRQLSDHKHQQHSFCYIFRHKSTSSSFILLSPLAIVNDFVFYGIAMDMPKLKGSIQLNAVMAGLFEIIGVLASVYLARTSTFGRKWTIFTFFLIAGSGFGLDLILDSYIYQSTTVIFIIIRKFGISGSFNVLRLLIGELFPSEIRSSVLGALVVVGGIGSFSAPMIVQLTSNSHYIFTFACFLAAALATFITETRGKTVPDVFSHSDNEYTQTFISKTS